MAYILYKIEIYFLNYDKILENNKSDDIFVVSLFYYSLNNFLVKCLEFFNFDTGPIRNTQTIV